MFDRTLRARFVEAVTELTARVEAKGININDADADAEVRRWLNGAERPLDWAGSGVTPDEWFFLTTLYGTMNLDGQRTHIRKFFPYFVSQTNRDVRNFTSAILADWRLRQPWMKTRLCRMADVLVQAGQSMADYVEGLRDAEGKATRTNPMPAHDRIFRDHRAGEGKTLSVFVRDCVKGNCFPIDSRVANQLGSYGLPKNERLLVSLCLSEGLNPRRIARTFFQAPCLVA